MLWEEHKKKQKRLKEHQLKLFWFENPKIILTYLKLNHYTFAVFSACLIVFHKELLSMQIKYILIFATNVSLNLIYKVIMARTLPRFTMCMSMGKLIDQQLLHECIALHHLEEAQRKKNEQNLEDEVDDFFSGDHHMSNMDAFPTSEGDVPKGFTAFKGRNGSVKYIPAYDVTNEKYQWQQYTATISRASTFGSGATSTIFRRKRNLMSVLKGIRSKVRATLMSKSYINLWNRWGAIINLTLLSFRMELFNGVKCFSSSFFTVTDRILRITFWLQAFILSFWTIESTLLFFSFRSYSLKNKGLLIISYGAAIDIVINITCLILLMLSEVSKCVGNEGCKAFSMRTSESHIEYFTVLITLRVFRYVVARRIVNKREIYNSISGTTNSTTSTEDSSVEISTVDKDHPMVTSGGILKSGTAVELWQSALAKFPQVVQKHGEFSSEILQSMLGIHDHKSTNVGAENKLFCSNRRSLSTAFSRVSEEGLAIVIAGLERNSVSNLKKDDPQLCDGNDDYFDVVYEIDYQNITNEEIFSSTINLSYPNSSLVLNMKRCHRKFLPLFNKWFLVDVVVTQFEIVYLDIERNRIVNKEDEHIMEAIRATNGGLGLRLCDVTVGRKVIGVILLSEVTKISIERDTLNNDNIDKADFLGHSCEREFFDDISSEKLSDHRKYLNQMDFRNEGASSLDVQSMGIDETSVNVIQDCLVIKTKDNSLYLRFFADFGNQLKLFSCEDCTPQNHAFEWARKISNICTARKKFIGTDELEYGDEDYSSNSEF